MIISLSGEGGAFIKVRRASSSGRKSILKPQKKILSCNFRNLCLRFDLVMMCVFMKDVCGLLHQKRVSVSASVPLMSAEEAKRRQQHHQSLKVRHKRDAAEQA